MIRKEEPQQGRECLIEAKSLGVRYGNKWLVRNVDATVRRGEIVTLIGPNGGGKSTTAKAVLGLVPLSEGEVLRSSPLKIGYVPQKLAIDGTLPLTVKRLMTLTETHTPQAIDNTLEQVGVAHLKNAPVQSLSGGEFQRVLLARAIIRKPDLLVLDEPVQGVDFNGEIALYQLISNIRKTLNCGILLISHDLHIVMAETDVVICLNGHVCCSGSPQTVALSNEYKMMFGGYGSEALAVYRHNHDHAHQPDGTVIKASNVSTDVMLPSETCCPHSSDKQADYSGSNLK